MMPDAMMNASERNVSAYFSRLVNSGGSCRPGPDPDPVLLLFGVVATYGYPFELRAVRRFRRALDLVGKSEFGEAGALGRIHHGEHRAVFRGRRRLDDQIVLRAVELEVILPEFVIDLRFRNDLGADLHLVLWTDDDDEGRRRHLELVLCLGHGRRLQE